MRRQVTFKKSDGCLSREVESVHRLYDVHEASKVVGHLISALSTDRLQGCGSDGGQCGRLQAHQQVSQDCVCGDKRVKGGELA